MKINLKVLQELAPHYGVAPLANVKGAAQSIKTSGAKAPAQYEPVLTGNGYEWDENNSRYVLGDQVMYFFPSGKVFLWVWDNTLSRPIQGTSVLVKWVQGDDKYPQGKANSFMGIYKDKTGQGEEGGGTAVAPEDAEHNEEEPMDRSDASEPTNPVFKGIGNRGEEVPEPSSKDPVDILIVNAKKKMGKNGTLPSDDILDLYQKSKELKSNKLMTFIKTIKPLKEGFIKKSTLDEVIRQIVKTIVKESSGMNDEEAMQDKVVLDIARQVFNNPKLEIIRDKSSPEGRIYLLKSTDRNDIVARFIWKTPQGNWKYLKQDPTTNLKKWIDVPNGNVSEETGTSAVAPVTTPFAFKKKPTMESDISLEEMTTTGAVGGYNIPGAFSKRGGSEAGVEGSESLGYTLTGIGKKDMQRHADKLLSEGEEADAENDKWAGSDDDLKTHGYTEPKKQKVNSKQQKSTPLPNKGGTAKVKGKIIHLDGKSK
jgi:hypothetical protein